MIQDIGPHVLKNEYCSVTPEDDDLLFSCHRGEVLLKCDKENQTLGFPSLSEVSVNRQDLIYLFALDEKRFFLHREFIEAVPEGCAYTAFSEIRRLNLQPAEYVFALFTGYHLSGWYESAQYCGRCGTKTQRHPEERAMRCPACGNVIYPRINPAVIVGVINGDSILITRYRKGYGGSALIAGFTEIGETLEETVMREVKEETGITVKNIRYYKSQPWGPAADILAGFWCEADGNTEIRMDENELRYACWVKREDVILQNNNYSLTNEMMTRFKEGNS